MAANSGYSVPPCARPTIEPRRIFREAREALASVQRRCCTISLPRRCKQSEPYPFGAIGRYAHDRNPPKRGSDQSKVPVAAYGDEFSSNFITYLSLEFKGDNFISNDRLVTVYCAA